MPTQNATLVNRFYEEFCNGRKLNIASELFTADHAYRDPSSPWVGSGPDGMQQLIGTYQSAFGDAHWTVNEILEAGDRVITRWTGTGTHSGDLMGLAPTNRKVSVTGVMIQRIVNGKIAETFDHWDMYGMLQQLGVAQAMGAGA